MTAFVDALAKLADGGGTITILDGKVRVEAPPGLLSDRDREILARHRDDFLCILTPARITDQEPEVVEDYHLVPLARCDQCGSFEQWQDIRGGWHCAECEPPVKAERLRIEAARLRNFTRRQAK